MTLAAEPFRVALVGNPNCGKTSLFNRLTNAKAKVANYPGVTVERRSGFVTGLDHAVELLDLPGTYSLFVASPDEQVARDVILGDVAGEPKPQLLIAVVDATNLHLGLRLAMELKSLNRPMVLALNQADAAERQGIKIDIAGLEEDLGIPTLETVAIRHNGVTALQNVLAEYARQAYASDNQLLSLGERPESVEALYARIDDIMARRVQQPIEPPVWQSRLDAIALHPVLGLA